MLLDTAYEEMWEMRSLCCRWDIPPYHITAASCLILFLSILMHQSRGHCKCTCMRWDVDGRERTVVVVTDHGSALDKRTRDYQLDLAVHKVDRPRYMMHLIPQEKCDLPQVVSDCARATAGLVSRHGAPLSAAPLQAEASNGLCAALCMQDTRLSLGLYTYNLYSRDVPGWIAAREKCSEVCYERGEQGAIGFESLRSFNHASIRLGKSPDSAKRLRYLSR